MTAPAHVRWRIAEHARQAAVTQRSDAHRNESMSPAKRSREAFTLIEVLIVVVIMAVLAATIIPQFSSSTKDARESSLRFNLHALRSQIELYKLHHTGAVP